MPQNRDYELFYYFIVTRPQTLPFYFGIYYFYECM